jgi:predicted nucleotidyltransferase
MGSSNDAGSGRLDRIHGVSDPTSTGSPTQHIADAAAFSQDMMNQLAELADDLFTSDETGFIVFGSLARAEFTTGSDVDWAVLIDGRAESDHLTVAHELRERLNGKKLPQPGSTGVFGNLVFSHDLIHAIGGDGDTNTNMTRRLLLVLESAAVAVGQSTKIRERMLLAILDRYLEEDASYLSHPRSGQIKIPRFLLNDIVRLWRTMAVDFATKNRDRQGQGWALRNIKLRMSRKLLLLSGLLMCISWAMEPPVAAAADDRTIKDALIDYLLRWIGRPPLDSIKQFVDVNAPELTSRILEPYDSFLKLLGNEVQRLDLEKLHADQAYGNPTFRAARELSEQFDAALIKLLFESNETVATLTKKYGVF